MDLFENRSASPMLIARQTDAFDDPDYIYELKMDGFRCLAYLDQSSVDLRNKRNLKMLPKFPELQDIYKNVKKRCILDGEVVVLVNGVPDFYRLQKRTLLTDRFKIELEASRYPASFVAFDCIYKENRELIWEALLERKGQLSKIVTENTKVAVSRYAETQGTALYKAAEERKLEGVVAKRKGSLYLMGKRTKDWIKFKRMADEDYVVVGYIQKSQYTFSLIIAKYCGDTLLYKGQVTSGVTKEAVQMLQPNKKNPFLAHPTGSSAHPAVSSPRPAASPSHPAGIFAHSAGNEDMIWVEPDHVCVVEYMPNLRNALRQPVFKGFRDDVFPQEVQEIQPRNGDKNNEKLCNLQ